MPFIREFRKAIFRVPGVRRVVLDLEDRLSLRRHHRRHAELRWQLGPRCPEMRVEPGRLQVGSKLFVFGGYVTIGRVSQRVDMLDLESHRWHFLGDLPEGAPQTHQSITHDGHGYAYIVGGQVGPNCAPATRKCFSFCLESHTWQQLPLLPYPRYMPIVCYHNGRIHCMTGNREDRASNADEHWSIAVEGGIALEDEWRHEGRFPYPRIHTATELVGDEVIVMAGQEGDVPRIDRGGQFHDSQYLCDFNSPNDVMHDEVFAYNLVTRKVRQLAPMPEAISHSECAVNRIGRKIVVAGGVLQRQIMAQRIHVYDLAADRWELLGYLPHPMKSKVTAYWNGRLYLVAGQRSISETDLRPGPVVDSVFLVHLPKSVME